MTMIAEDILTGSIADDITLNSIEPHIYSVFPDTRIANEYDTRFGIIYDLIACNPLYNRLIWGYSIAGFSSLVHDALRSSKEGTVLDLGCGSLAFTAKTYINYSDRPVVLTDQSLKMLRIAKSRLIKLHGRVPDNMVFLQADALQLPFKETSFNTLISLNLLHCIDDTKKLLTGLTKIISDNARMFFTTLIRGDRLADRYLKTLADSDKLISRSIDDHRAVFEELGIPLKYNIQGNMAFMTA